jgi:hypothetical protein
MLYFSPKFKAATLLGLGLFLLPATTHANDVEVRSLDEIKKEVNIILSSPAIQKALGHKEVQKALNTIDAHIQALEAQAKFEAEKALGNKKQEAQAIAQDRWDATVGKLIKDYKESGIPKKLEQGDWSAIEETKALVRSLQIEESFTERQSGSLDLRKPE